MYLRIVLEIIAAMFAVFGFYSAVRLFANKFFGDDNIIISVHIKNREDAENAETLIREALGSFLLTSSCRVAVLADRCLEQDEALMGVFRKYGVEYYFI